MTTNIYIISIILLAITIAFIVIYFNRSERLLIGKTKNLEEIIIEKSNEINEQKELISKQLKQEELLVETADNFLSKNRNLLSQVKAEKKEVEKQKERSEELLLNILPKEIAHELKETGAAQARFFDSVTVLFVDFKGFTELSSKLSPEALVQEINICFSAFDHIMEKNGVEKIKTIGDAYMAVGGLPVANNSHPTNVLKAANEILEFMEDLAIQKKNNNEYFFEVRVGINSGPVVAGIVGVKKFQYDVWGDTVNTASRMESSGEVGKINISESTYDLVKDSDEFKFNSRGKVNAKGKGMLEMYFAEAIL